MAAHHVCVPLYLFILTCILSSSDRENDYSVGPDHQVTYRSEPKSCETRTASLCSTTTFLKETVNKGTTQTITASSEYCETVQGCSVTDHDSHSTKTTRSECPLPTPNIVRREEEEKDDGVVRRQAPPPPGCPADAIVYPKDPMKAGNVPQILNEKYAGKYTEVKSKTVGFISFWFIPLLDEQTMDILKNSVR